MSLAAATNITSLNRYGKASEMCRLKSLILLAAVIAVLADFADAYAAGQPNILLIVADDLGFSDTSPYGGEIFTPNIASLAYQGAMFTNFHVAPTCTPTRAMLLTGRDNHVVGVGNMKELLADNQLGKPGYEGGLNSRAVTIATILRTAGYHTYMAGKWHLGQTKEQLPASQGFEESVVLGEGGADNWEKKPYTPKYQAVHFYEGFNEIGLPELQDTFPDYYRKNFDLTYEHLGEKGSYSEYGPNWASVSMTPLSGFKIMTSEGGTRAPLIIRYPKKVAIGESIDAFAYVLDVVPTLLDLAGIMPQQGNDLSTLGGRTMVPLLAGSSKETHDSNEVLVTEIAGNTTVYRGDYKLVRNLPPFGDKQWHLYDIRVDPTEATDISSINPDLVKTLTAAYADYVKKYGVVEVPDDYSVVEQAKKNMARGNH
jgi:arylsulfatase A-like enzyme